MDSENKVLILGTSDSGGVSVYVSSYLNELKDFKFYVPFSQSNDIDAVQNFFPKAQLVQIEQNYSFKSFFHILTNFRKFVKKNEINIIHAHTLKAGLLATFIKLSVLFSVNLVYTGHGLRYTQKNNSTIKFIFKYIEAFANYFSNQVIFIRNDEYNLALEDKIISKTKAKLIITQISDSSENKYSFNLRKKFKIKSRYIVVNAATVYDLKNPDLFIRIAKKTIEKNEDITFLWIGGGDEVDEINSILIKEEISESIKFVGHIHKKYMNSIFSQIDAVLLTSKIETFPLTILEAFMQQKVVFSSNFKGVKNLIRHDYNGFIFKENEYKKLTNLIVDVISDKNKSDKISKNAYNVFKSNFNNMEKFINEHNLVYKKLSQQNP
jgi:glycosyltransferase involved in cell wall biosynthesis